MGTARHGGRKCVSRSVTGRTIKNMLRFAEHICSMFPTFMYVYNIIILCTPSTHDTRGRDVINSTVLLYRETITTIIYEQLRCGLVDGCVYDCNNWFFFFFLFVCVKRSRVLPNNIIYYYIK